MGKSSTGGTFLSHVWQRVHINWGSTPCLERSRVLASRITASRRAPETYRNWGCGATRASNLWINRDVKIKSGFNGKNRNFNNEAHRLYLPLKD